MSLPARINLLPPEERRRGAGGGAPGGLLGILLAAGALVVVIMVGVYLFYELRLRGVQNEIATLDTQITEQQQLVAELAPYQNLQDQLQAKKPVVDGIYATRFDWPRLLQALSFVTPQNTSLTTFTAQSTPINVQATEGQILQPPGTITFTGIALPDYQNVADFVVQMNELRFLTNTSLNTADLDRETYVNPVITFEVTAEMLTTAGENGMELPLDEGAQQNQEDLP